MQKRVYTIKGMSCAACALKVERAVAALEGVSEVNVMLLQNRLSLRCDEQLPAGLIEAAVAKAGYSASLAGGSTAFVSVKTESRAELLRLSLSILLTLSIMLCSMGTHVGLPGLEPRLNGYVQLGLALAVMLLQRHYFQAALQALGHLTFNMNTLIALGATVSCGYSIMLLWQGTYQELYFEGAASILSFVAVGKYLEGRAKLKTTDAVSALYDLAPRFVRVVEGGRVNLIPWQEVKQGQVVQILSGDQVGIDGVVLEGSGHVNESALTGESVPVRKQSGDQVLSSTVLLDGALKVRAVAVGEDTTLAKIIQLVNDTASGKASSQRLADKLAGIFVPGVILLSVLVFGIWYGLQGASLSVALNFALAVLVISCPCALGLATPVAIMAGTGRAARAGILFKSPQALERLQSAQVFAFDKTGTLTYGNLTVRKIISKSQGLDEINVLFAASLEQHSSHPLARAFLKRAEGSRLLPVSSFTQLEGQGITGRLGGVTYALGNERLAETLGCELDAADQKLFTTYTERGFTTLGLYQKQQLLALFVLGDELKQGAAFLIRKLEEQGKQTLMLTGDQDRVARALGEELSLTGYRAQLLPAAKAAVIKELQEQGQRVVMVGDGINDSVSLTQADIGIGMAGASDLSLSCCDVVLLKEHLYAVYNALIISQKTMLNIKENLFWAFIYNIIFIPLAAGALYLPYGIKLTPMYAALLMSLSSVCVVLNALRLTRLKVCEFRENNREILRMHKEIAIEGMHCEHCVAAVNKYLSALPGVEAVKVSLEQHKAELSVPDTISDELLTLTVENAGFKVKDIKAC